jgi:hypothetical protein
MCEFASRFVGSHQDLLEVVPGPDPAWSEAACQDALQLTRDRPPLGTEFAVEERAESFVARPGLFQDHRRDAADREQCQQGVLGLDAEGARQCGFLLRERESLVGRRSEAFEQMGEPVGFGHGRSSSRCVPPRYRTM